MEPGASEVASENAISEQQNAIRTLLGRGMSLTQVARSVGVSPASVRAWRDGRKVATGRGRVRLLGVAATICGRLDVPKTAAPPLRRGRHSARERSLRAAAMKEAGLWPPEEFARRLRLLTELARRRGASADDVAAFLRVSRRTLYCYLAEGNARLPGAETLARLNLLGRAVGLEKDTPNAELELISLEDRFARASLVLFGLHHYVGFLPRDPQKEQALRWLAGETGFSLRTVRRYLPIRDKNRRLSRSVVDAFEGVARRIGRVI
jgi:transcriptional regulator with XRE-family HTH domain